MTTSIAETLALEVFVDDMVCHDMPEGTWTGVIPGGYAKLTTVGRGFTWIDGAPWPDSVHTYAKLPDVLPMSDPARFMDAMEETYQELRKLHLLQCNTRWPLWWEGESVIDGPALTA